ncbi:hypothetical protein LTR51_006214 [Lithohypha guttulata]|nr:hypothetical protein LTR51_006214 [Lithohypha guttulata]
MLPDDLQPHPTKLLDLPEELLLKIFIAVYDPWHARISWRPNRCYELPPEHHCNIRCYQGIHDFKATPSSPSRIAPILICSSLRDIALTALRKQFTGVFDATQAKKWPQIPAAWNFLRSTVTKVKLPHLEIPDATYSIRCAPVVVAEQWQFNHVEISKSLPLVGTLEYCCLTVFAMWFVEYDPGTDEARFEEAEARVHENWGGLDTLWEAEDEGTMILFHVLFMADNELDGTDVLYKLDRRARSCSVVQNVPISIRRKYTNMLEIQPKTLLP